MRLISLDHVQLAMPAGGEGRARDFYFGILGLETVEKPDEMKGSGGIWFRSGSIELHLGVDPDFRPAIKAHPALRVDGLDEIADRCDRAGHAPQWDERYPGIRRFYVHDPFGNRIELLEPAE